MAYELPPIGHALSGGVAAALANVVIYPLDMATTRVQSQSTKDPASIPHSHSSSGRKEQLPIEFKRPELPSSTSSSSSSKTSALSVSPDGRKKTTTTTITTTTRTVSSLSSSTSTSSSTTSKKTHYTSVPDALRQTYRSEGFSALYAGLGSDTLATLTSNFVYFYVYMALRQHKEHRRRSGQLSTIQELFLGAEAGVISRFFTAPIHVVTTRQQVIGKELSTESGKPIKVSARAIIRDIYAQDGILGFWAGYAPTVILSINPSITYFLFETLKKFILARQARAAAAVSAVPNGSKSALVAAASLSSLQIFFISACSKAIASFLTYPLILTKTKLQTKSEDANDGDNNNNNNNNADEESLIGTDSASVAASGTASSSQGKTKGFDGISDVIRTVVKDKGIKGLYTGCQGQVVKGFFSFGLMYMIKDRVVAWMLTLFLALHNMRNRVTSA
ncbi:mitochondrial carrier domain-containing protein [Gamsiella multidivaricata]|uniref:mitochondrial carrier domain-containing protein n=1 Tax=Gamsiella multidivaricata TaxID=101098 RepID=UPI0022212AE1|nr:mitochondrial carrier domain-containing protein [Gamsiella multidivaricata]KAG0359194.1 hypothetical protein BGZ54_010064 [Gamsiella multidivaricata]KAI7816348.1 mitochondrial carrier domain-containing protein [Gamsiella multidivaricata]